MAAAADEAVAALARGTLYETLAIGFRPPSDEMERRLGTAEGAAGLAAAAAIVGDEEQGVIASCLRSVAERVVAGTRGSLAAAFARMFGHTTRGCVVPYETEYGNDGLFRASQELADVGAFVAAFGLRLDPLAHERVDHVSVESELIAFLCRKEAHALAVNDTAMRDAARRGARLFLRDHLARFARAFSAALEQEDPDGVYGGFGALLASVVRADCRRLGIPEGPAFLRIRDEPADAVPMACGASDACGAGETCAAGEFNPAGGPDLAQPLVRFRRPSDRNAGA